MINQSKKTKNLIGILLFILLPLASCDSYILENTHEDMGYNYCYETELITFLIDDAPTTPAPHRPFDGNMHLNAYRFLWDEGRDRDWEEDIIFLASRFRRISSTTTGLGLVSGHPLISGILSPNLRWRSPEGLRPVLQSTDYTNRFLIREYRNLYDKELRMKFFDSINDLIAQIPELTDYEIIFGINRILALIGDWHTRAYLVFTGEFAGRLPIWTTNHFDEQFSGVHLYSWPHPRATYVGIDSIINTRLLYINGVSIEEIYDKLRPITIYDRGNETSFRRSTTKFLDRVALRYIGVMQDEEIIPITVRDVYGNVFTVYAPFVASMDDIELTAHQIDMEQFFMASRSDENYWFQYFPDESMMYLRYWRCEEMPHLPSLEFAQHLRNEIINKGGVDTFVLDLRSNPGGFPVIGIDYFLEWAMDEENRRLLGSVYVAVDSWTNSGGVITAAAWQTFLEDVVLIGSPPSGNLTFFTGPTTNLPNSGAELVVGHTGINLTANNQINSILIPDIIVYRTLEDYINHHDAVIATIIERATERRAQLKFYAGGL